MRPTRRALLATTATGLALSGCLGDGGGGADGTTTPDDGTTTTTPSGGATTTTDAGGETTGSDDRTTTGADETTTDPGDTTATGTTVAVRDHPELGEIIVDGDGMTLYMFDSDTRGAGESTCSGGCAESWPPVTAAGEPTADDGVTADLTTFERGDGSTQVAAGGWPLYYFAPDEEPGDVQGQGANDVWWVLDPGGSPVRPDAETTTTATTDPGGGGDGAGNDGGGDY